MKHRILAVTALLLLSLTATAHADPGSPPVGLAYFGGNKCLTKAGPGLDGVLYFNTCNKQPTQHFMRYRRFEPDIYEIRDDQGDGTGRCVSVVGKSNKDGADVMLQPCDSDHNFAQLWRYDVLHEPSQLRAVHSNLCLGEIPSSTFAKQTACTVNTRWSTAVFWP